MISVILCHTCSDVYLQQILKKDNSPRNCGYITIHAYIKYIYTYSSYLRRSDRPEGLVLRGD